MSYGSKPFQGIKNSDVIKLIEDKKRLEKPDGCPDELYELMLQCSVIMMLIEAIMENTSIDTYSSLGNALVNIYKEQMQLKHFCLVHVNLG